MKIYSTLATALLFSASVLPATAQTTPPQRTPAESATPEPPTRKTLVKLGLGVAVGQGYAFNGFNDRFYVPLTFGIERQLNSSFSAYANLTANLLVSNSKNYYPMPLVSRGTGAIGGRYYYNQAKRAKQGRAAGPFVGNYLALQASTDLEVPYWRTSDIEAQYAYSTLSVLWGMQRRLGTWFLYDLSAGLGVSNQRYTRYNPNTSTLSSYRRATLRPELNLRFSLVH